MRSLWCVLIFHLAIFGRIEDLQKIYIEAKKGPWIELEQLNSLSSSSIAGAEGWRGSSEALFQQESFLSMKRRVKVNKQGFKTCKAIKNNSYTSLQTRICHISDLHICMVFPSCVYPPKVLYLCFLNLKTPHRPQGFRPLTDPPDLPEEQDDLLRVLGLFLESELTRSAAPRPGVGGFFVVFCCFAGELGFFESPSSV